MLNNLNLKVVQASLAANVAPLAKGAQPPKAVAAVAPGVPANKIPFVYLFGIKNPSVIYLVI